MRPRIRHAWCAKSLSRHGRDEALRGTLSKGSIVSQTVVERSSMPRRPLQARSVLAVWLLLAAACGPVGATAPTPTYPPAPVESATAPPRPTAPNGPARPTEVKPTAVPVVNGSPVALRSDITIRKLLET